MAKMSMELEGLNRLLFKLQRAGANCEKAAEAALAKTHEIVTKEVDRAQSSSRYNLTPGVTGATARSVARTPQIENEGGKLSVGVGWRVRDGGLASLFLMHGTPTITPDRTLYEAIWGRKVHGRVREEQQNALAELLADGMVRR